MTAVASNTASLLPEGEHRNVSLSTVSRPLARAIEHSRRTENLTPEAAIMGVLQKHRIELPAGFTISMLADWIRNLVVADEVYDSELNQAHRASCAVLARLYGKSVPTAGWFAGDVAVVDGGRFELTGKTCPDCEINPECYGIGGGVRCLDERGCGWWFCY
ncbi:hypothetical protein [Streptomyces sp. A5-4]|uniref:hypothetical protein n=1 Tax=Streptomyces sp. A5-4 TaxID=3384771 RepID=UPI003DA8F59C